ncbi:ArpU family phage packaging/lysis transcriptional regulator [Lactobacillus helveticus]|uniref:ArpU family phage packaging/lysis transcriptional regulator n=1 Tax=Lactobacillus helveticus TaxID=1587 RepID=UPI0015670177|nr:ArpU family phage packaging/lysis transcriptional regulator [Lactobacillus helveticus]NRO19129.1 hypothetical protein [Lactobacillus helveticus]
MNIYSDIDTKATAKNVDHFLRKQLPHIMLRCGRSITDLSSPKLSLAPVSTSMRTDRQETMIINAVELENVVQAVHNSILACSDISKIILMDIYIHQYTVDRTLMDLPYERSQYFHKLKPKSLVEFADYYDYWQSKCKVNEEDKLDLHIYKD